MATLQQILDRKKDVSGQVSTQTRTLALGMLAISWALLTVHDDPLRTMALNVSRFWMLSLAVCAVLVIAFDLLQYVAATKVAEKAIKAAEAASTKTALFDDTTLAYKAQAFLYHAKFYVLVAGAVLLMIIFIELFRTPAPPQPTAGPACCPTCATAPGPTPLSGAH